ncbi:MAG: hypothetical protein IJD96_07195 [Lachnospiraceae bacterium]|nr:hypothetical protein [Lachnospiraceae bacterium]
MDNLNKNESFHFTYSAKEQEEIKKIRQKYIPENNKMDLLRRLDKSVTQKGTIYAIALGIIGSLLLGIGMCCTMVWSAVWFLPGIAIGIIGIGIMVVAYPAYNYITKKEREKIAPEILRLADELMK